MATLGATLSSIRSRLDEPVSAYWTDIDLRRWVNEIAADMARRSESLRGSFDADINVGESTITPDFASTTNLYRLNMVEFIPDANDQVYPLEYVDRNVASDAWGLSQQITQGIPAIWTSWGYPPALQIQVYPSPSLAGTLRLWYYRLPVSLALDGTDDATEVDVILGWEDVLVDGVEYKAKRRDSDPLWNEAKQEYEAHLEAMMEASLKFTDANGSVVTNSGMLMPAWLYGGGTDFF